MNKFNYLIFLSLIIISALYFGAEEALVNEVVTEELPTIPIAEIIKQDYSSLGPILGSVYFGNPLLAWIYFFGTIIVFVVLAKVLIFVTKTFGRIFTAKTKSDFDDILIDLIEEPLVLALLIIGLYIAYNFLIFDVGINAFFYQVIKGLLIIDGAWFVVRIVEAFLERAVSPLANKTNLKLDDQLVPIIRKAVKGGVIGIALIIVLDNFGFDVFGLVAGLGIGGIAIAFAAKETIADMFGGLSVLISKPFVVGDFVTIGSVSGTVAEIGLRYTRIRNWDGRLVTIPNSQVATAIVENISSEPTRKIKLNIGLTYGTPHKDIVKAMKILKDVIESFEECKKEPNISFSEFQASSLNILVMYYVKKDWIRVRGEVNLAIKKEFDKAKLDFALPSQSIYIEKK